MRQINRKLSGLGVLAAVLVLIGAVASPAAAAPVLTERLTPLSAPGKCLDVLGHNTANGSPLGQWTCNSQPNQLFDFYHHPTVSWSYEIVGRESGKCLDGWHGKGAKVVIEECDWTASQAWRRVSVNGYYAFQNMNFDPPLCLSIDGASTANGASAILWTCHNPLKSYQLFNAY